MLKLAVKRASEILLYAILMQICIILYSANLKRLLPLALVYAQINHCYKCAKILKGAFVLVAN